jgi:hypothetical protein
MGSAELVVLGPDGGRIADLELSGSRVTVGRLPENDVVLQPDPDRLVTRSAHCTLERDGARWVVVDGGSVNGTSGEAASFAVSRGEPPCATATWSAWWQ